MEVGTMIRTLIKRKGLKFADVRRACEMTEQQLTKIMSGKTPNPGILTVKRILDCIGARLSDLDEAPPMGGDQNRE